MIYEIVTQRGLGLHVVRSPHDEHGSSGPRPVKIWFRPVNSNFHFEDCTVTCISSLVINEYPWSTSSQMILQFLTVKCIGESCIKRPPLLSSKISRRSRGLIYTVISSRYIFCTCTSMKSSSILKWSDHLTKKDVSYKSDILYSKSRTRPTFQCRIL